MLKRIYEMTQRQGETRRFLATSFQDATNQADPLAGEIMELRLYDDRHVNEYTSLVWLDKVLNFDTLTIKTDFYAE